MNLFGVSASFSPLEVHGSVRAVSERQMHLPDQLVGTAQFRVRMIVRNARTGLEQKKRLVLHRVVHVVEEREAGGLPLDVAEIPVRIAVVADEIALSGDRPVVQRSEGPHHIRGERLVGITADGGNFHPEEIQNVFRNETHPVQPGNIQSAVPRIHLGPVGKAVAPERRPVAVVEMIERPVAALQKFMELLQTAVAPADRRILVADVPARQSRMIVIPLRQQTVDPRASVPVDRTVETCALPRHPRDPSSILLNDGGFRIPLAHPSRPGGGRCGKENLLPPLRAAVHDRIQPGEIKHSLFQLNLSPGEDPQRERVASGAVHQFKIPVNHLRVAQPLIRIPVSAMQNIRKIPDNCHSYFSFFSVCEF